MKRLTLFVLLVVFPAFFSPGLASGDEQDRVIRLCYPNKAQYAPFILARQTDAWKRHGLAVRDIVIAGGGIEAAEALVAAQADMAAMGDAPALIALGRNANIGILSSYMTSVDMHRIIVSPASGITRPTDLIGKRIAVHMGSSTHGGLLLYLNKNGIGQNDVVFVTIPPQYFPEAMEKSEVDAIAGSEPWPQNVLDRNPGARQLATLGNLGNNYPHLILARKEFVKSHPQASQGILQVIGEMELMLKDRPEEAARIIAESTGRSSEKELAAISELQWQMGMDASVLTSLARTAEFLMAEGKIKRIPDLGQATMAP